MKPVNAYTVDHRYMSDYYKVQYRCMPLPTMCPNLLSVILKSTKNLVHYHFNLHSFYSVSLTYSISHAQTHTQSILCCIWVCAINSHRITYESNTNKLSQLSSHKNCGSNCIYNFILVALTKTQKTLDRSLWCFSFSFLNFYNQYKYYTSTLGWKHSPVWTGASAFCIGGSAKSFRLKWGSVSPAASLRLAISVAAGMCFCQCWLQWKGTREDQAIWGYNFFFAFESIFNTVAEKLFQKINTYSHGKNY